MTTRTSARLLDENEIAKPLIERADHFLYADIIGSNVADPAMCRRAARLN